MDTKAIVVTGASPGICAAVARQSGTEAHWVVLAPRRERELQAVTRCYYEDVAGFEAGMSAPARADRLKNYS
jgi:NADP-dependent 3-hydroxy acid dehydrogenase YdfG